MPNGNLTSYIIKCTLAYDNLQILKQRDYCDEREYFLGFGFRANSND